jgi:DNA-binding transcriptional LysR family regulator
MNYTLNQLRIFIKVAETLSITKASDELHLTQPAVSIQLKNFQNQFDISLFETINKKIYITEFGYEILNSAQKILQEIKTIDSLSLAYKGELTGELKISVVSTGKYIAPYFIADFIKQNQGIDLTLDVTNKTQVIESLTNNETDFALVSVLPEKININKIELMENKLYLVVGNQYSDINKDKVYNQKLFENIPMIFREHGSGTRHVVEKFLLNNKIKVLKKMELTSNEAVKQAVLAGLGFSVMPLIGIKNEIEKGLLQIVSVKGLPITSKWTLIWLKNKANSTVAHSFLTYLIENKDTIIHEKFDWIKTI